MPGEPTTPDSGTADGIGNGSEPDGLTLTRRDALALLGTGATAGTAAGGAAASSSETWQNDRDARGHDLVDAGTVETRSVELEGLDADRFDVGSLGIAEAELDHVATRARAPDRVVWEDETGTFHADGPDGEVASGEDLLTVTQAAVDSLTSGRTRKETVLVAASGTIPDRTDDTRAIELPSYTVLDVPGTLHFEYDEGSASSDMAVRIEEVEHVAVPRLNVSGGAYSAVLVRSSSDVAFGRVNVAYAPDSASGHPFRIDDGTSPLNVSRLNDADDTTVGSVEDDDTTGTRCEDVRIGSVYAQHTTQHALETFGVDRCRIGEVIARHHEGCAVLYNDTQDATIGSVVGYNPDSASSYATFRAANFCENVTVGQVVSRDAPRGVHVIGGSRDVTVGEVCIVGARDRGIKIDRIGVENVDIQGGRVKNVTGEAVLSQGEAVSIRNLRIVDDRPEHDREQTHAIHLTTVARNNRVVNNDVRRGGTDELIRIDAPAEDQRPTSVVRDNVGDGIASGRVVLQSGSDPAARVEGVTDRKDVTLEFRASVVRGPADGQPLAWDGYFEWNGDTDQWDLVVEWETDPLENVELEYVVDQPLAAVDHV